MTTIAFETERSDGGWATWGVIGAMALAAATMMAWQANAPVSSSSVPQIVTSAEDCAACHAGPNVLASATLGHAEIGLDLVLVPDLAPDLVPDLVPGASAVHTRQDCASCHSLR